VEGKSREERAEAERFIYAPIDGWDAAEARLFARIMGEEE
jgi:hypothetical protein